MKKMISRSTAEVLCEFASQNGALVEQKLFTEYDRMIVSTPDGCVSIKSPLDGNYIDKDCSIENFHGFDNKASKIADRGVIIIKGYNYI